MIFLLADKLFSLLFEYNNNFSLNIKYFCFGNFTPNILVVYTFIVEILSTYKYSWKFLVFRHINK